jgi:hypothetical protein
MGQNAEAATVANHHFYSSLHEWAEKRMQPEHEEWKN